jgi:type II secretory pathway pseudopilin PulG
MHPNSGPQCYGLVDSLYPQFSDICGTLPQVRYSLPNAFGHTQRWQIAQTLSTMLISPMPSASNPVCYRSLRLLICPLLFQPCMTPVEPVPAIPCKPFCQAVKAQCAAPSLDLLPCDYLPLTSTLCLVNPTPYSSILASYGQQMVQQSGLQSILGQSALSMALAQAAQQQQAAQQLQQLQQTVQQQQAAQQIQQQQQGAQQQGTPGASGAPFQIPYQAMFPSQTQQTAFPGSIPPQLFFPSATPQVARSFGNYFDVNQQQNAVDVNSAVLINTPLLPIGQNNALAGR